jgi:hypothetical protein
MDNTEMTYREVCDAVAAKNQAKRTQNRDDRTQNGADSTQIGGSHYQKDIQPWDYMKAIMSEYEFLGYLRGNVIKYISRYKDKGGVEDLRKAQHYLTKLIEEEL